MPSPREIAFQILRLVEKGGYASDLLLSRARQLDSRDAALAHEIVFGVLRHQSQLDFLIQHYSARSAAKLDPEVRAALRMSIYQQRYLDRIPNHAAVSESVDLVKRAKIRSAAGFVNAVLRKVTRDPIPYPTRAIELSHPPWLLDRWDRQYGAETATAIAQANLHPPVHDRDPNSQSIIPLLHLAPHQTYLDLCAAPGNKTAQALAYGVQAVACDLHLSRLRGLHNLGIPLVVLDGARPLPFNKKFDRILVDAPCSGTGTLARNPEIKWRLKPSGLPDLQQRQSALLRHALTALAPDGILVYATCSLEQEENEAIVAPYKVIETRRWIPGRDPGDGFFAAVIKT